MDCNRDEAARSRGIAEKKFMQQDYLGARKFALKARQLFPDLEGLVQFIAVVDVHITAHEKLQGGEMNLYGILQSDPSADEACLRKQFRKLALVLHPDKNKALGAEAAFKFVSEAWTILSDKAKKAVYDRLRSPVAPKTGQPKKSEPGPKRKQTEKPPPTACNSQPPHHAPSNAMTFWTACPDCKLLYEYHTMYKNKNLCCPFCMKAFLAKELSAVIDGSVIWPPLQEQNRAQADAGSVPVYGNGYSNGTKLSNSNGKFSVPHSSKLQENAEGRKENIGVEAAYAFKEQVRKKEMDQFETKLRADAEDCHPSAAKPRVAMEQKLHATTSEGCKGTVNEGTVETTKSFTTEGNNAPDPKAGVSVNVPYVDPKVHLDVSPSKKAKVDVQGSIKEQFTNINLKTKLSETENGMRNADHCMSTGIKVKTSQSSKDPVKNQPQIASKLKSSMCDLQMNCDVQDSVLYIFDNDRTEQHFSAGQLWACYDDEDGFPRHYAQVVEVLSRQPFKVQYTWLEACSPSNEVLSWLDSGFSYTCGEFKLGKTLAGESLCMFSHVMTFEKGQKSSCFKVFPRKGEVWALYQNWATLKRKDEKFGYDLVEVLTDYSDEVGVQVCMLVKVQGFRSVFKQRSLVKYGVLPEQMRMFSHNIPLHRPLAGEIPECIEGCLELDPTSTPIK